MTRRLRCSVALALIAVLTNAPVADARCRLLGRRHRQSCQPSKPVPTAATLSQVCARFYFGPVGSLHLHYGGTPPCSGATPATTHMYLPNAYCNPFSCTPCDCNIPGYCYCEPVHSHRGCEGIDRDAHMPPDIFGQEGVQKGHTVKTGNYRDDEGAVHTLKLYRVKLKKLRPLLADLIGKEEDYFAYEVEPVAGDPEPEIIEIIDGKCGLLTVSNKEYDVLLMKDE